MNKIVLIGNLTRDPELRETNGGVSVCSFSIAVNRSYTGADGERQTDFFNCTAWRGLAENIAKYCKKGNKIGIAGSIENRTYEDSQGVKRHGVEVVVREAEFLSLPKHGGEEGKPVLQTFDDDGDIPF